MWKILSIVCARILSACGVGPVSPETTRTNLALANIDSVYFPWAPNTGKPGPGGGITKRWGALVPVKTNGDSRADVAMDRIEKKLGKKIFDRQSIQTVHNSAITRGLIFSKGTAYVKEGRTDYKNWRGNVASDYPAQFFNVSTGVIDTLLYVNLDNAHAKAKPDDVVHELGHALGLGEHFDGFAAHGTAAISKQFWAVLKTLYNNPPGTRKEDVKLAQ
jgi:hypothetical protein